MYVESASQLNDLVLSALRGWNKPIANEELHSLLVAQKHRRREKNPNGVTIALLNEFLTELALVDEGAAELLRLRYYEEATTKEVAYEQKASIDQINRQQRKALDLLIGLIWSKEHRLRTKKKMLYKLNSPVRDRKLIGRGKDIEDLFNRLQNGTQALGVTGLGGIGKSALVYEVGLRLIVSAFIDKVVWIKGISTSSIGNKWPLEAITNFLLSGNLQALRSLSGVLSLYKMLFVIDGAQMGEGEWERADRLASKIEPSRILITARTRPTDTCEIDVYQVRELGKKDSLRLFKDLLGEEGDDVIEAGEEVYALVGGNPGAIRYIANQLGLFSFESTLAQLSMSDASIYASTFGEVWQQVREPTRELLNVLSVKASTLNASQSRREALREAYRLSLIDVSGSLIDRKYSIPRIAKTYQKVASP